MTDYWPVSTNLLAGFLMGIRLQGKPKNQASYIPTGRIWPSGDFSLGYRKVEADSRVDYRREPNRVAPEPLPRNWVIGPWGIPMQAYPGPWVGLTVEEWCEFQWLKNWHPPLAVECPQGATGPLDLTTPANSHSEAGGVTPRGRQGITSYGRKMVKSAATLIQKMPGKRVTFATITMPPLPQQLRAELAREWPEFVRQLIQWLSRRLKLAALPALICSVSEVQPRRLQALNEGYLHLHLCWPNHYAKSGNWAVCVGLLKTWCSEFLQKRGLWTSDSWVNVDTKQVKKTAAGYLAKYMSKGVAEIEAFAADCGWDAVPKQWWNLSKPARDLVKKYTCVGDATGALLEAVVNHALDEQELKIFHVLQPAILAYDGKERIVGWFGVLTTGIRLELVKMIRDNSRIIAA